MASLFSALQAVLRRWFGPSGQTVAVSDYSAERAEESGSALQVEEHDGSPAHLVPYDENLLERSRTQWQFGDWDSLAQLSRDTLQHHPDRARLALLAAAGRLQIGLTDEAKQFIRLANEWGVSKKLLIRILAAGVHNSLGRAAAIIGEEQRALQHFHSAVATGSPGSEARLLTSARINKQYQQLGIVAAHIVSLSDTDSVTSAAQFKPFNISTTTHYE